MEIYPELGWEKRYRGVCPEIPAAARIPLDKATFDTDDLRDWDNRNQSDFQQGLLSYDHVILPSREEGSAIIQFDILEWGDVRLSASEQQILEITVESTDAGVRIVGARTPTRSQQPSESKSEQRSTWCPAWIPPVLASLRYFFLSTPTPPDPPGHTVVWHNEWDDYGRQGTFRHLYNRARGIIGYTWPLLCIIIGFMFVGFLFFRQRLHNWWNMRFRDQIATVREAKARRARWRRAEAERRLMFEEADLDEEEEGLLAGMDHELDATAGPARGHERVVSLDKVLPPPPVDKELPPPPTESKPLPPLPAPTPDI